VEDGIVPASTQAPLPGTSTHQPTAGVETPVPDRPETGRSLDVPLFGARGKARELATEVARLASENSKLKSEMDRLGMLSAVQLEQRRAELQREIADQMATLERQRQDHASALERQAREAMERMRQDRAQAEAANSQLSQRIHELRQQVVVTEEVALLQEAGVYQYRHPLTDAVAYQGQLARLQERIKVMTKKDGGAVLATTEWRVNGSMTEGRAMVRDFSKLMLRAYNAEADNLVRGLKPYKLDSAVDRISKVATTIARLGKTMNIRIAPAYHQLRIKELELTADYVAKVAEEKEREREEKARLREERRVQQEIERERARLEKERQHYANALAALVAKGDEEAATRMREQLGEIDHAIEDVDYRAANVRAGYVYVISNLGAFGENMVKVGMTRRLDPRDRVRELSDASVPFNFDIHALFFSDDAVGIEAKMHARLADQRVNRVNQRREFFYATPHDVKQHLLELAGDLLQYEETPEALEYHQSVTQARETPASSGKDG
jgi:hypothetical protein